MEALDRYCIGVTGIGYHSERQLMPFRIYSLAGICCATAVLVEQVVPSFSMPFRSGIKLFCCLEKRLATGLKGHPLVML